MANHFMNPQIARMHERASRGGETGASDAAEHPIHHVQVHHHPDGGGRMEVHVHHRAGGHEVHEHDSHEEAADHVRDLMGPENGSAPGEGENEDDPSEDVGADEGGDQENY